MWSSGNRHRRRRPPPQPSPPQPPSPPSPPPPPRTCNGLPVTIQGTDNGETLIGTPGNDVIDGQGGNDVIRGRGGNDVLCGGDGRDRLFGGPGRDRLFGGAGRDELLGDNGRDALNGGTVETGVTEASAPTPPAAVTSGRGFPERFHVQRRTRYVENDQGSRPGAGSIGSRRPGFPSAARSCRRLPGYTPVQRPALQP